jgi:hypothetical protein
VNEKTPSFGRRILQTDSVEALLALEHVDRRSERFQNLDDVVGQLLLRSLQGERIVDLKDQQSGNTTIKLLGLSAKHRTFITKTFSLDQQQARGAWFIPDTADLRPGVVNLPAAFKNYGRFATGIAWEENAKVALGSAADTMVLWAVLEPLFDILMDPLILRGKQAGTKKREDQLKRWKALDDLLNALGFSLLDELAVMRYGGGWHTLNSAQQHTAKLRLLTALGQQVHVQMGARYRAYCVRLLAEQYYKKAKDGRAKRTQTLTKPLERMVSGVFGGDWLALLDYFGEEPHPEEQIVTALPDVRLHVGGQSRAAKVAAEQGIPIEEVERMLAAFWQQDTAVSPVEQRVAVLRRYWNLFDDIHARQAKGMTPLWGLVDDHRTVMLDTTARGPYYPGLYRQLLPAELRQEIEQLWGTKLLPQWPERIISEPFPHVAMAETLGPALQFWQGCALTAWFICEGPMSRTDIAGLAAYYREPLKALEEAGTPVNPELFRELRQAEKRLGPEQPVERQSSTIRGSGGVELTLSTFAGSRRDGFEQMRDLITHHRRSWAAQYLDIYLRGRWEGELRESARVFNQMLHNKGKAPTLKQFVKAAEEPSNHWFGGDISALYGAIGEKAPGEPQRHILLPKDTGAFVQHVYTRLQHLQVPLVEAGSMQQDERNRQNQLERLAQLSIWYGQLREALDRPPTLKEFGPSKFDWLASVLHNDTDSAWEAYRQIIDAALGSEMVAQPTQNVRPLVAGSVPPKEPNDSPEPSAEKKRSWFDRLFRR